MPKSEGGAVTSHKRIDPFHHIPINDDWTTRKCLQCEDEFKSTGSGHRMCVKCRNPYQAQDTLNRKDRRWPGPNWEERDNVCREAIGMKARPVRGHPSDGWV